MKELAREKLLPYSNALKAQERSFEFLCELPPPPEHDLEMMLKSVGQLCRTGIWNPQDVRVLAWAAVLFCGEQEDTGGFRGPFMESLGFSVANGFSLDQAKSQWDNGIGQKIREALHGWCGREHKVGKWKYVGPVRIHAGIPKPLERRFAQLLICLATRGGLSKVAAVSPKEMGTLIDEYFGGAKFAREFLHLDSGRLMIASCAAHLDCAGWPGDTDTNRLDDEPEYRPGFLRSLYGHMERIRHECPAQINSLRVGPLLLPYLYLDIDSGGIGLRFPGLNQRPPVRYELELQPHRKIQGDLFLGTDLKLNDAEIRGTAMYGGEKETWSLSAWPRLRSLWALFALDGEFVGADGDQLRLDPGNYFLATRIPSTIPKSAVRGSLGWLDVDENDYGCFQLLEVELSSQSIQSMEGLQFGCGREMPSFSIDELNSSVSDLSRFACKGVVVLGDTLSIQIKPWNLGDERFFRLHHERDGHDADVTSNLFLQDGIATLQIDGPEHHGRLRIERRGREAHGQSNRAKFSYTLWSDDSQINLDQRLYSYNEPATICVKTSSSVQVKPAHTITVNATSLAQQIKLLHQGNKPSSNSLAIDLHVTIPRARLESHIDRQMPLVIDRSEWQAHARRLNSQDDSLDHLSLCMRPSEDWELVVEDLEGHRRVLTSECSPDITTHRMSYYQLSYSSIEDALRQVESPVGCYRLRQVGRDVELGAIHLDSKMLRLGKWELPKQFPDWVPSCLKSDLREMAALQKNGDVSRIRSEVGMPIMRSILADWRTLAQVIAGQLLDGKGLGAQLSHIFNQADCTSLNPADAKSLLEKLHQCRDETLLMHDVGLKGVTPPCFVNTKIRELAARLSVAADARERVVIAMRGILERTKGGAVAPSSLHNAVRQYSQAYVGGRILHDCVGAVDRHLSLLDSCDDQPWRAVVKTFRAMNLLRQGEVKAFLRCSPEESAPLIGWLQEHLRKQVGAITEEL